MSLLTDKFNSFAWHRREECRAFIADGNALEQIPVM